jgi:hypothetical protein
MEAIMIDAFDQEPAFSAYREKIVRALRMSIGNVNDESRWISLRTKEAVFRKIRTYLGAACAVSGRALLSLSCALSSERAVAPERKGRYAFSDR